MSVPDGPGPSLRRSVAIVWRTLRSMRTAIILLLMLAAASVVGSLVPQLPNSPARAAQFLEDHAFWGRAFQAAGFFDVFGSWWFVLITALLFVSLVACLVPRSRAMIRAARARPIQARELDAFPSYAERHVSAAPGEAASAAARTLRKRRFRVELDRDGGAVAAEKGSLREIGSLAFHWAFLLLLVAVIVGKGTGYIGHATIVEGYGWTDARLNYDGQLRTGRFFSGDFSGTQITLQDFQDAYRETGQPMDYRSSTGAGRRRRRQPADRRGEDQPPRELQRDPDLPVRVRVGGDGARRARRRGAVRRAGRARAGRRERGEPADPAVARRREALDAAAAGGHRARACSPMARRTCDRSRPACRSR